MCQGCCAWPQPGQALCGEQGARRWHSGPCGLMWAFRRHLAVLLTWWEQSWAVAERCPGTGHGHCEAQAHRPLPLEVPREWYRTRAHHPVCSKSHASIAALNFLHPTCPDGPRLAPGVVDAGILLKGTLGLCLSSVAPHPQHPENSTSGSIPAPTGAMLPQIRRAWEGGEGMLLCAPVASRSRCKLLAFACWSDGGRGLLLF